MKYRITANLKAADALFEKLERRGKDMTPLLDAAAGVLEDVAEEAFETETSPDGAAWPALSQVTIRRRERGGHWPGGKLQVSGRLAASIGLVALGPRSVIVGTNVVYAAAMQFGARKGAFGKGRRPVPWGDIPPRPYLGISQDAEHEIEQLIADWLNLDLT